MGRPRKNENEAKSVWKTFRLTPKQAEAFQRLSTETGMNPSQLARAAAIGMKQVYISDDLLDAAREISRHAAQIGNLFRLHATLLEVIDQNPSLTDSDREELIRLRELLEMAVTAIRELKMNTVQLRGDIQKLHGYL